jgi:hypothetical protein
MEKARRSEDLLKEQLDTFVARSLALRGLAEECPWFPVILVEVLRNRVWSAGGTAAQKKLDDYTEKDAVATGRTMPLLLLSNATPEAAVDEWVLAFPALQTLDEEFPFFRPFMNAVMRHLLSIVDIGLKMRLLSGTLLSLFDLASDLYMSTVFLQDDETRPVAYATLSCLAISLMLQAGLTAFVNKKRGWKKILREVL